MKIEESASKLLETLNTELIKGLDFAKDQLPDVVNQILTYELLIAYLYTAICGFFITILLLACIYSIYKLVTKDNEKYFFSALNALFFLVILVCPFFINLNKAIKIKVAPKVYVIEYVSDLAR